MAREETQNSVDIHILPPEADNYTPVEKIKLLQAASKAATSEMEAAMDSDLKAIKPEAPLADQKALAIRIDEAIVTQLGEKMNASAIDKLKEFNDGTAELDPKTLTGDKKLAFDETVANFKILMNVTGKIAADATVETNNFDTIQKTILGLETEREFDKVAPLPSPPLEKPQPARAQPGLKTA